MSCVCQLINYTLANVGITFQLHEMSSSAKPSQTRQIRQIYIPDEGLFERNM